MDTWSRPFFSYPSSSVNSQLCRTIVVVCSCDAKQPDSVQCSSWHSCVLHPAQASAPCDLVEEDWKLCSLLTSGCELQEQIWSWSGAAMQPQSKRGHSHLQGLGGASALEPRAVPLIWRKLTPAPFETHSGLEKRPWFSLNVRVLESVWIPGSEQWNLKQILHLISSNG